MKIVRIVLLSSVVSLLLGGFGLAERESEIVDSAQLDGLLDEGVDVLCEYLAIDTSNPPGREIEGARFLAGLLEKEGIPYQIFESATGRANLYARLEGDGDKSPILLLQHIDVVPPGKDLWVDPPFGGNIRDGYIWGRGAVDMKGLGIVHLMSFLALKRSEELLERDVVLLATADEEAGGQLGLAWFLDNHFELVEDVGLVVTEGGFNLLSEGRIAYIGIENSQKLPVWVRLTVRGPSGHGSVPFGRDDYSAARLVRALNRILDYESPLILDPEVAEYFRNIAFLQPDELRPFYENAEEFIEKEEVPIGLNRAHRALFQNTVALTVLEAGSSTNVIPSLAFADLDCRLVPSQDPNLFLESVRNLIGDPAVQIETLFQVYSSDSPASPEFSEVLARVGAALYPEARIGSSVLTGFTDAFHFRKRNIPAFGFSPFADSGNTGAHAVNERIGIETFQSGLEFFYRILSELALE